MRSLVAKLAKSIFLFIFVFFFVDLVSLTAVKLYLLQQVLLIMYLVVSVIIFLMCPSTYLIIS